MKLSGELKEVPLICQHHFRNACVIEIWDFKDAFIVGSGLPENDFGVALARPGRLVGHQSFSERERRWCHTAEPL